MQRYAHVIVDIPVAQPLDYRIDAVDAIGDAASAGPGTPPSHVIKAGSVCVVPVGGRRTMGIVVGVDNQSDVEPTRIRALGAPLPYLTLSAAWLELARFAAEYYHHAWGEIALPALPPLVRSTAKARKSRGAGGAAGTAAIALRALAPGNTAPLAQEASAQRLALRAEQGRAVDAIAASAGFAPFLLFGVTGSGKTEVYLHAIERLLRSDPDSQALLLVPEINLTPQLHARLAARFPERAVVSLHSGLAPRARADAWLLAHRAQAQIVLGTRTAVFASLPRLRLIVVDEEHDPSFKAHGGVPYSARDLAVKRAHIESIPVVLGSATPSLETWQQAQAGRYRLLMLEERGAGGAGGTIDPAVELVDLRREPLEHGLAAPLRAALQGSLERGEQALVFINRRGFAPVLRCAACEWLSKCPRCDAFAAYHKVGGAALRCHHCGWTLRVPQACPDCGNQDLQGVGQGTQRIEEALHGLWPQARIVRIDRDSTRDGERGSGAALDAVHAGAVDILVGTQMIAKGHDFRRVGTVGVLNADAQLVAADFRAPERLFALLMQVTGRAGRAGQASRVLIQTRFPGHPLFAALARRSYAEFADEQLRERRAARMPPFVHHALLTTAARTMEQALGFLDRCAALRAGLAEAEVVKLYDAVPMPLARLASEARAQLLVESSRRADLHAFLAAWLPRLRELGRTGVHRWSVEVDPQAI